MFIVPQKKKKEDGKIIERQLPKVSTALFFKYNEQLGNKITGLDIMSQTFLS